MRSAADSAAPEPPDAPWMHRLGMWNRRLHSYAGLYLLVFIWLFAFTGLLLNHPRWAFAEFWSKRRQTTESREISPPTSGNAVAQARDLARQLGVTGELEWTTSRADNRRLDFRLARPGQIVEVKADLARRHASVTRIDLNSWGVLHMLHTFTGVRIDDPRNRRDWSLTTLWALAMDAVAAGLVLLTLSGLYMWYESKEKRLLGAAVLTLGWLACGWFCYGLGWFYSGG